ncbi:Hypothetical protein FKW44_011462, partial [Caligus rogercresseyi]
QSPPGLAPPEQSPPGLAPPCQSIPGHLPPINNISYLLKSVWALPLIIPLVRSSALSEEQ